MSGSRRGRRQGWERERWKERQEREKERQGWEKGRETGAGERERQGRKRKNYKHKKIHGILSYRASIRLPVIITLSASAKHCLYYDIVL